MVEEVTKSPRDNKPSTHFIGGFGTNLLQVTLQIANDVIPFDAHRVFLSWSDMEEQVWHYPVGFLQGDELSDAIERSRSFFATLKAEGAIESLEENDRCICLARVDWSSGVGYIGIARDAQRKAKSTGVEAVNSYSQYEKAQLRAVAYLLGQAIDDHQSFELMHRLHLNFLDRRTVLLNAYADEILLEYLRKAVHVVHDISPENIGRHSDENCDIVRASIQLVNDNGLALRICESVSTVDEEWTSAQKARSSSLPENEGAPTTIDAMAYHRRDVVSSSSPEAATLPVDCNFGDTSSYASAPICASQCEPVGVLTIETTATEAYTKPLLEALRLLAAHMTWPMQRAIQVDEFSEVEKAFVDELWQLRRETKPTHLFDALGSSLNKLKYPRGMISKVNYVTRRVEGIFHWGGDKMHRVQQLTNRCFDSDSNDCQIKAVFMRELQCISNPCDPMETRVSQDSLNTGELKPFSVYPILDNHGIPRWTLHVERHDGAALGSVDDRRVAGLCNRMMNASEESSWSDIEQNWYGEMFRTSFFSFESLLQKFADFIFEHRVVSRCRIFLVNDDGKQLPFYQAGILKSENFETVVLGDHDINIARESIPILCVLGEHESQLSNVDSDEFKVISRSDPHVDELNNRYRSQWLEVPVEFEGTTMAKLVFDHSIDPTEELRRDIGLDDAFSLGEIRLIGRMARILGVAAEVAQAYQTVAGLCCAGIHGKLLWHFLQRSTSRLFKQANLPTEIAEEIDEFRESLDACSGILKGSGDDTPDSEFSIGRELSTAIKAVRPFATRNKIDLRDIEVDRHKHLLATRDHSLFLIVVTLLENAIKYRTNVDIDASSAKVDVNVDVDEKEQLCSIIVRDWGIGFDETNAKRIKGLLEDPTVFLKTKVPGGLSYAAFLARSLGWELDLVNRSKPTSIRIIFNTQEAKVN